MRYRPGENELEVEFNLGTFLVLFEGPERDNLLRLIAALLPGGEAMSSDESNVVRPMKFISRWMPR
ncbi:hypothetical protein MKK75_07205 [Methylobacterium sp. J-030]|uniref:hypothetical protein n=1 Tax=Methylobacterium sp. J-030 TaxID=2836627 RepID=UPI001FBB08FC|nr:hypothetical protein [Methylobacterium sp. J-030]MCJ2068594.1 hypothetical protein [Methylobacterium sp. J-030]